MHQTLLVTTIMAALATPAIAQTTVSAAPACSSAAPNYAASAGGFGVLDGKIYSPGGTPFTARGINVNDYDMASAMGNLLQQHPGTNFIRIAVFSYKDPSAYQQFVGWATKQGIVVEFENHQNSTGANIGGGIGNVFTNANGLLQPEQAWYAKMAAAFKTNPYVWFGTNNEPTLNDPAGLAAWQQATYDSVRKAGNNNPILIEEPGGGALDHMGSGVMPQLTNMTNIIKDMHYYPWTTGRDANSAASTLSKMVQQAQTIQSADGKIPVLLAEVGQYDGTNNNTLATKAAMDSASRGETSGVAFWEYNDNDPNNLSPGTAYGQQIAPWIAASGTSGCPESPIPTPVTVRQQPTSTQQANLAQPAPDQTSMPTNSASKIIMPNQGSTKDAQGNAYTIDHYGNIIENGSTPIPGGGGTSELVIINGVIYGKDNGHGPVNPGGWFTFSNGYWTPSSPSPLVAAATVQFARLTAQPITAPDLAPASTAQTAPALSANPLSINEVAALAARQ